MLNNSLAKVAAAKYAVDPAKILRFIKFKDGFYNKAVNLTPALAASFVGQFNIQLTKHALEAANSDRFGLIRLPEKLDVKFSDIVEVRVIGGRPASALIRISHDEKHDLCLPVVPVSAGWVRAVSCWLNRKDDNHSRFNRDYSRNLAA